MLRKEVDAKNGSGSLYGSTTEMASKRYFLCFKRALWTLRIEVGLYAAPERVIERYSLYFKRHCGLLTPGTVVGF